MSSPCCLREITVVQLGGGSSDKLLTYLAVEWKMQHLLARKDNEILMDCGKMQSDG